MKLPIDVSGTTLTLGVFLLLSCSTVALDCSSTCNLSSVTSTQIGNQHCDLECNTPLHHFDSGSDGISDCTQMCRETGCDVALLGNGLCDSLCQSAECGFDHGDCECAPGCFHDLQYNSQCDEVCAVPACSFDSSLCVSAIQGSCAVGCFPSMLHNGVCDEVCNNEACGYDADDCERSSGWIKDRSLQLGADNSTEQNPTLIYVSGVANDSGEGSYEKPFKYLNTALGKARDVYTTIYLLGNEVIADVSHSFPGAQANDPIANVAFKKLLVQSLLCSATTHPACSNDSAVINFRDGLRFTCTGNVVFDKVKITAAGFFENKTIKYCPYLQVKGSSIYDDRGKPATADMIAANAVCETTACNLNFFTVEVQGSLTLTNVDVFDFTVQQTSVIWLQGGSVTLQHVLFTNIQSCMSGAESGVILKNDTQAMGSFEFIGGSVSLLNNGYEYGSGLQFSSFLYLKNLPFPVLSQVTFAYNNVLTPTSTPRSLLYFEGMTSGLNVSDCYFLSNVVTGGLISVAYPIYIKSAYAVVFNSLNIVHNFGQISLIDLQYEGLPQSTQIESSAFEANSVPSGDIVHAEVTNPAYVTLGSNPEVLISNLTLVRNTNFHSLLSLSHFDTLQLIASNLWLNGDLPSATDSSPLASYMSNSQVYMSLIPDILSIASCSELLSIEKAYAVDITSVDIRNNECQAGFVFQDIMNMIEITAIFASRNSGVLIHPMKSTGLMALGTFTSWGYANVVTTKCTFYANNDTSIWLSEGSWQDYNSNFSSSLDSAVVLYRATARLSGTSFESNLSPDYGGGISLSENANLTCVHCTFINNSAETAGGGLYIEAKAFVTCVSCEFSRNHVPSSGAAVFISMSLHSESVFSDSTFRENASGDDGTISVMGGKITLENNTFAENWSKACPGISAVLGQVKIFDSHFFSQEGFPAAFVYLGTDSFGQVYNSDFRNSSGSAFFVFTSELHVTNSSFEGLPSPNGGLIYGLKQCIVFLTQVSAKNTGGAVELVDCDCTLDNSTFEDFSDYAVLGSVLGEAAILGSSFRNGRGNMGGAVYLIATNISILYSTFANISAQLYGGAIYAWGNTVTIQGSLFYNNTAQWGGGVFLEGLASHAVVSNSTFLHNSAENGGAVMAENFDSLKVLGSTFQNNFARNDGGAIFLSNNSQASVSESTIENNTSWNGGGIMWSSNGGSVSLPYIANVSFKGNSARYGSDIASFAEKLDNVTVTNCFLNSSSDCSFNTSSNSISDIPPGQLLSIILKVQILDHQHQTYLPDSYSFAVITPTTESKAIVFGISKVPAINGTYTFNAFGIEARPGSKVELYLDTSTGIRLTISITVQTRDCVPGEYREAMACTPCVSGTYGFNSSLPCTQCPSTATCYGGASLVPKEGYWRPGNYSELIRSCPNPDACLAPPENPPIDYTGKCAEGYTGIECQSCEDNYYHSSLNVCKECPDLVYSVLRVCGCALLVLFIIVVIVVWVLRTASTRSSKELILCKIFLNFVQLSTPVFNYTANWEEVIRLPYTAEATTGVATGQLLSIDCLIADPTNVQNYFFTKMLIVSLIPFVLAISATVIWSLIAIKNRAIFGKGLIGTFIVVYFIILAMLMKELFSALSCVEVLPGEYWLTADLNIRCMNSDVAKLVIPSIIIWGLVVPLFCFGYLFLRRRELREESFKVKFGFLTSDYRNDKYYWEFVLLVRKCSIAFFSGFNVVSSLTQAITIQLILLVFLALQYKYHPYYHNKTNAMEWYSLLVVNLSIFCCLYSLTSDFSQPFAWVLFVIGALVNACFLAYWVIAMKRVLLLAYAWMKKCTAATCRLVLDCFRSSDERVHQSPRPDVNQDEPEDQPHDFPEPNTPVDGLVTFKEFQYTSPDALQESPYETIDRVQPVKSEEEILSIR